jgi:hypothetical protein
MIPVSPSENENGPCPGFSKIFKDVGAKTPLALLHAYPAPENLLAAPKKRC